MLIDQRFSGLFSRKSRLGCLLPFCGLFLLAGCGGIVGVPLGSIGPPPTASPLTGNWQIAATTTAGTQPFSALTGSIVQEAPPASGPTTLVSVLQAANPGQCYLGQPTVPSDGSVSASSFFLTSFSVDGQYLTLSGTPALTGDSFTGNFSISGGCGDGVQGTVSGIKVGPLTGTYGGSLSGSPSSVSLALTQDATADGFGYFHVQGTANFTGSPCFTSGTLDSAQSTITGEEVVLTIQTNESPSSTAVATGTVTALADTLTLSSLLVTSGGCAGMTSSGTVMR